MNFLTERFDSPALLWHLVLVAAVAGALIVGHRKRRRLASAWPRILQASDRLRRGWRTRLWIRALGLTALVIAMAGPRGGESTVKRMPGRDVMIVLDLSRSMAAEQPSRLEKAIRSLRSFASAKQTPAGTRVGMVVFAARPWLAFPLTSDVRHVSATLDQLAAGDLPSEIRGDKQSFDSGTRIGAALQMAVDNVGGVKAPSQNRAAAEILLVSDGDDPLADREWLAGVAAARSHGIAVNTVAVGEPGVKATIPYRGDVLRYEGSVVTTAVQSQVLDEIAHRTGGRTFAIDRSDVPLASLLGREWAKSPPIEVADDATAKQVPAVRCTPCLLVALLALLFDTGLAWPQLRRRAASIAAGVMCIVLVSAEPASLGRDALRRGEEAYRQGDFDAAIAWFDKAQPLLADPGVVAFNRGAAHYRLKQYAAAAADYRRALSDAAIPPDRRDRARFDLGNSLLQEAGESDRRLLTEAIASFKQCLAGQPDLALKIDADYNLDVAARRLAKLQPEQPKGADPGGNDSSETPKDKQPGDSPKSGTPRKTPNDAPGSGNGDSKDEPSSESSARGQISVLLDESKITPMTAEQAAATLAAQADRIAAERRRQRLSSDIASPSGKDW